MLRAKNIAIVTLVLAVLFSVSKTAAGGASGASIMNMLPSWFSQWFFEVQTCGMTDDGMGGSQCGGSCPQGQSCGIDPNGSPFGGGCACGEGLPTEPPAQCGRYQEENPDGTTSFRCGGACPMGQTCGISGGQPFGSGDCGCVEAIPVTPPAQCGRYAEKDAQGNEHYKCGGACPMGQTCMIGQGFGFSCVCGALPPPTNPSTASCGTTAPLCNGPCPSGEICAAKADDGTGRGSTCECVRQQTEAVPLMP